MVECIIASTLKFLVVKITGLYWIFYDGTDKEDCEHIN